jgi:hypothetical protein
MATKKASKGETPKAAAKAKVIKKQKIEQVKAELAKEMPPEKPKENKMADKPEPKEEKSLGQSIKDVFKPKSKTPPPVKVEEKEGHAVTVVDVPARSVEVSLAYSAIEGCAVAAVEAWERVRDAKAGDVPFAEAQPDFRQHLINSAEEIYRGGQPAVTDTTQAKYEREVAKIRSNQEESKAKAAKVA